MTFDVAFGVLANLVIGNSVSLELPDPGGGMQT
jgi:hypothetical protein